MSIAGEGWGGWGSRRTSPSRITLSACCSIVMASGARWSRAGAAPLLVTPGTGAVSLRMQMGRCTTQRWFMFAPLASGNVLRAGSVHQMGPCLNL